MAIRYKPFVAACAALLVAMVHAMPAHATAPIEDRRFADFTFTFRGEPVTCTVFARTYAELSPDESLMSARTVVWDRDPVCYDAVSYIVAEVTYSRGDQVLGRASAESRSAYVAAFANTAAPEPTRVVGNHLVVFACDADPTFGCWFSMGTSAK